MTVQSVGTPVNVVPIADDSEDQKHERNQEESGGLQRINLVAGAAAGVLLMRGSHNGYCSPQGNTQCCR